MFESDRYRVRIWWAKLAATTTVVFAVGVVGARQVLRMLWSHAH